MIRGGGELPELFQDCPKDKRPVLAESEAAAIEGADVLFIATDWPQFVS